MKAVATNPPDPHWSDAVHAMFKAANIRQIAIVPDAGHARLIRLCEKDRAMRVVRLTTEEEGIALLGGAWLGGEKGVLLMQSSGVGNCINMLSLSLTCQFPLLTSAHMTTRLRTARLTRGWSAGGSMNPMSCG